MRYTGNYSFRQPERAQDKDDRADIEDLTYNWDTLDTLLQGLEDGGTEVKRALEAHANNFLNPHKVTPGQIGAYTKAEVDQRVDGYDTHLEDRDNPHETTADQVGAYTKETVNSLLDGKVDRGGELDENAVLVTNATGAAVTSILSVEELERLSGIEGNVQQQLDYLLSILPYIYPRVTLPVTLAETALPEQDTINAEVLPEIETAWPQPSLFDGAIAEITTADKSASRVCFYFYLDGSTPSKEQGWQYLYSLSTLVPPAEGNAFGIVSSSPDISFTGGQGTVHHAEKADEALKVSSALAINGVSYDGSQAESINLDDTYLKKTGDTMLGNLYMNANGMIASESGDLAVGSNGRGNVYFRSNGINYIGQIGNVLRPLAVNAGAVDLGADLYRWRDLFLSHNAYIENDINVNGEIIGVSKITGPTDANLRINSPGRNVDFQFAGETKVVIDSNGSIRPTAANTGKLDLGTTSQKWRNLYLDGNAIAPAAPTDDSHLVNKAYVDSVAADTGSIVRIEDLSLTPAEMGLTAGQGELTKVFIAGGVTGKPTNNGSYAGIYYSTAGAGNYGVLSVYTDNSNSVWNKRCIDNAWSDWIEIGGGVSGDYLPLTGGEIAGDLGVTGSTLLSGATIAGDAYITGRLTAVAGVTTNKLQVTSATSANTINGFTSFTGSVTVPTPTADTAAATKKYVDDSIAGIGGGRRFDTITIGNAAAGDLENEYDLLANFGNAREIIALAIETVSAQGGGTVKLARGTYGIGANDGITIPENVRLVGSGKATIIRTAESARPTSLAGYNSEISNLSIEQGYNGGDYIYISEGSNNCTVKDIYIYSDVLRTDYALVIDGNNANISNICINYPYAVPAQRMAFIYVGMEYNARPNGCHIDNISIMGMREDDVVGIRFNGATTGNNFSNVTMSSVGTAISSTNSILSGNIINGLIATDVNTLSENYSTDTNILSNVIFNGEIVG